MIIIDGKKVSKLKIDNLKEKTKVLNKKLGLVVIQVGNDLASKVYIKQKEKLAKELGYDFTEKIFASDVKEDELIKEIRLLNNDKKIDGIIVQLPLPNSLDSNKIINEINPLKDVDGLTHVNAGKLVKNVECLVPCTAKGIIDLLDYYQINVEGKKTVVLGRSVLVGKPVANLLTNKNATVTICHSKSKDIKKILKKADLVIMAIGKKHFLQKNMIKKGAIVIDVGINLEGDKIYGDVDFNNVKDKCSYITKVPGGVGPMTVFELMNNVYIAYLMRNK